jgi:hypothetical protein
MAQADRVLSTPPTNTPTSKPDSAPGAVQLSPSPMIPVAPDFAGQGVNAEPEPCRNSEIHSSGAVVSRRSVMNMLVCTTVAGTALPAAALAQMEDQSLLDLERDILDVHRQATADDEEISQCMHAWRDEWLRLDKEAKDGRINLTQEEISEAVGKLPSVARQKVLNEIAQPHYDRMDDLIEKMWAIPARTAEGKRAKFQVLLICIAKSDWLDNEHDADYDTRMIRSLLLELLGGEQAERFKKQFAA